MKLTDFMTTITMIKYTGSAYIKRLILMAKAFRFSSKVERSDIATEILSKMVKGY